MDGRVEIYECEDYRVSDGMLWLVPPRRGLTQYPRRSIPIAGVRLVEAE
jgi:hypothetical protein